MGAMNPLDWSLIGGAVPVILLVAGLAGAVWLIGGRAGPGARPRGWPLVGVPLTAGVMAGLVITLAWLTDNVWRPFPDQLPTSVVVWSWAGLAGLALALTRLPMLRTWRRRAAALLAGLVMLLGAANQINGYYEQYPTLRTALGPWLDPKPVFVQKGSTSTASLVLPGQGESLESVWNPPASMPKTGRIFQVDIPGTLSGFRARPGYLYLPPAYLTAPRPLLPVLVLLAGQPGDTRNWVDTGRIQAMMDDFASRHNGLAPVVVMPDDLGSELANPLCVDSQLGHVQTYLTRDVPDWISSHLQVRMPGAGWAVGGFSDGGTCAIQLATQAPGVYPVFVDISGQRAPSLGSQQRTISRAFGGDSKAFARVNPVDVMARSKFTTEAGVFVGGDADSVYTPQQRYVYKMARRAGMSVSLQILPGGHNWRVWRAGLARNLGWLAAQLGITQPGRIR